MNNIFINEFGRLRSGWRAAIFFLAFFFFYSLLGGAALTALFYLPEDFPQKSLLNFFVPQAILLVSAILLGWLSGKFLESVPFRALGAAFTKNWLTDFAWGFLIGGASIGLAALILFSFGATEFRFNETAEGSAIFSTVAVSFVVFAVGAAAEEAFFRGYIFQTFTRAKLALFAFAFTSLWFAAMHTGNPSANYLSFFNTLLAGVWFGAAYLKTRTLWLAFGLHLAWNWMQGAVLGISVSGISEITTAPVLQAKNVGAEILTGGDYGIEGGFACTIALIVSTLAIWFAPFLKPTEEQLILTNEEKAANGSS